MNLAEELSTLISEADEKPTAWGRYKQMIAKKKDDFGKITHNVATMGTALISGGVPGVIKAVANGKLKPVSTPIGGFKLGEEVPADVKKHAREIEKQQGATPEKAYRIAWSIKCKYGDGGSHCHHPASTYFPKR